MESIKSIHLQGCSAADKQCGAILTSGPTSYVVLDLSERERYDAVSARLLSQVDPVRKPASTNAKALCGFVLR